MKSRTKATEERIKIEKAAGAGELQEGELSRRLACQNKGRQRALTRREVVFVLHLVIFLGPFTFGLDLDF